MWVSGLRGAMAYALALSALNDLDIGPVILIDTLIYAMITILGIGSILNPLLSYLGVKRREEDVEMDDLVSGSGDGRPPKNCVAKIKTRIRRFDNETFAPLFIK